MFHLRAEPRQEEIVNAPCADESHTWGAFEFATYEEQAQGASPYPTQTCSTCGARRRILTLDDRNRVQGWKYLSPVKLPEASDAAQG